MMRITIAGDIGSGKTTIARIVGEKLGVKPLSTGGIQRQLAAARGVDTITLNLLAEEDPSIDAAIDGHLRSLPEGPLVVESRMAWRFVPDTLKVFLYVVSEAAAERIVSASRGDEVYSHQQHALRAIDARRMSEIKRFSKYYAVNIADLRNYDLVVDTTHATPRLVADKILSQEAVPAATDIWLSPLDLVPTQSVAGLQEARALDLMHEIRKSGFDHMPPISVLYVDHVFYIADGHARAVAAVRSGVALLPAVLVAADGEQYRPGVTAEGYVKDAVSNSLIYDWENAVGVKYKYPIQADARPKR